MREKREKEVDEAGGLPSSVGGRWFKSGERRAVSVRVSPGGYLAVSFVLTFVSIIFSRNELETLSLITLFVAWPLTLILSFFDRISFDGQKLSRSGIVALVMQLFVKRMELAVGDIERVETSAVRTLRSAGRVRYRYRLEIKGGHIALVFASGGKSFREMARRLLTSVTDEKLDARSAELRDYLTDQKSLNSSLESVHLAPSSVLDEAAEAGKRGRKKFLRAELAKELLSEEEVERGRALRLLANQLRVAGRLRESAEAFRRAFLLLPDGGGLLYEYARLLRSQSAAAGDARLLSRSRAALRLALRRATGDARVFERVGESLTDAGDLRLASESFRLALLENSRSFRSEVGLADIALRRGQLAHVVHHFRAAESIATEKALRRFAKREADYYALLNDDDDYMVMEFNRIKWLQNLNGARRTLARATFAALMLALAGAFFDDALASVGWSIASGSLAGWISTSIAIRFLLQRRKLTQN